MALVNFVTFLVFKMLDNLVSMQNSLNANNCWRKQNSENCPTCPHFQFNCFFENLTFILLIFLIVLAKILLLVSYKMVFIQNEVFTCIVIKIQIFHSCRTCVFCVALVSVVSHLRGTRVVLLSLVLHLCRSCLALIL